MNETMEVSGLVVREVTTGEADKILTILTPTHGKLSVRARQVSRMKSKNAAASQLFAYSDLLLKKDSRYFHIAESKVRESFEGLRYDIVRLSLAAYLCDVAGDLILDETPDEDLLSLTLNALFALSSRREIPDEQIKGAFELKAAVFAGFMPETEHCGVCGKALSDAVQLDVMNGRMVCGKCRVELENDPAFITDRHTQKIFMPVTPNVLDGLRYVIRSSVKRYLSFRLDEGGLSLFSTVCEQYLLNHLGHGFSTLTYYKNIK